MKLYKEATIFCIGSSGRWLAIAIYEGFLVLRNSGCYLRVEKLLSYKTWFDCEVESNEAKQVHGRSLRLNRGR